MSGKVVNQIFLTPVKRSHVVSMSGVGALLRTKSGITALVTDLSSWEAKVPTGPIAGGFDNDVARQRYLVGLTIHDAELEAACGVDHFITPPRSTDKPSDHTDWILPVVRFPLAGVCVNWQCRSLHLSSADDPFLARGKRGCVRCASEGKGRAGRRSEVQQLAILLVCQAGHIDEIDWSAVTHPHGVCAAPDIEVQLGVNVLMPRAKCRACGGVAPLDFTRPCSGARPWIPRLANEACGEQMHVVERTSVKTYYAQTKSAIHIPADNELDEHLLAWLIDFGQLDLADLESERYTSGLLSRVQGINFLVTKDQLIAHVKSLIEQRDKLTAGSVSEWDGVQSRSRELDVFSGASTYDNLRKSELLEFEVVNLQGLRSDLFGNDGLFSSVTAVHRLTETRVLDGFSRWTPETVSLDRGFQLLWGKHRSSNSWLPGYRVYGEGILFILNQSILAKWGSLPGSPDIRENQGNIKQLSLIGHLAHSLAHVIMAELSNGCGYPLAGIRDRIYDLPDGRSGFLVYTADGDSIGTLGGLVDFAFGQKLEELVATSINTASWCPQDPVCIGAVSHEYRHQPGACHQCLLVPETSCERFNKGLDRALIHGSSERGIFGVMKVFHL